MTNKQAISIIVLSVVAWVVLISASINQTAIQLPTVDLSPLWGATTHWVMSVVSDPKVVGAAIGVATLWGVARRVWAARPLPKDPQRDYKTEQRRAGFERAGNQCEYDNLRWMVWVRCPKPAEHADHAHPWSKGGATTLENLVASCARHNTSKGARLLTRSQLRRLSRRRKKYLGSEWDGKNTQLYIEATRGQANIVSSVHYSG